jgi:hypothetical protein
MHLHTVYIGYSECLPTLLNPLAERACFSQVGTALRACKTLVAISAASGSGAHVRQALLYQLDAEIKAGYRPGPPGAVKRPQRFPQ